jgi:hypothetical protein
MPRLAPLVRRNLRFPGSSGPTNSNPTLRDILTALIQVQQNQAQILSAIDALQQSVNTLSLNQDKTMSGYTPGAGNTW